MVLWTLVLLLSYPPVVGRVIAQVVSSRNRVPRARSELLLVVVIRTTRNEHVLEGYPRVSPLRDDSRLEYNGDTGFGREVVAESASNVFYSIGVTRAHTIAVAGRGLPCNRKLFAVANTTEKKVVLEGGVKVWSTERVQEDSRSNEEPESLAHQKPCEERR